MKKPLKILLLEDNPIDAEIIQRTLLKEIINCEFFLAMNKTTFLEALEVFSPEIILSDNSLPQFNAIEALKITRQRYPHIPFILVTGTVSDEYAADVIKGGADDYILKDRLTRLPAAIDAALKQRAFKKEIADYKYALDQSADVTITDQKGIIIYANENFCNISRFSAEELIGKDHRITNSGYHPASFIKNLWVTIARGRIWQGEFRNKAKDGSFYWEDTTIVPFLDQKGKPYQYLAIRQDITKRKEAEEELLQSEMKLKEAQAVAHISNWEVDFEQNTNSWSDEFYRIYGLTKGDVEPSPELFLSFIHPNDAGYAKQNVQDAFDTSKDSSFEFRFIRKDGITRHGRSEWKFEFNKKGKPVRLYGIMQDITERKEAEEELTRNELRFRTLTSNAPVGIFQTDDAGKTIFVNETWMKFTGLTFNEAIGDGWQDILHPDDREKQIKEWEKKSKKGLESSSEYRILDKKGNMKWVTGKATPLYNINQQITGFIGTITDITERKKADELLKEINTRYEFVNKATQDTIWEWDYRSNKGKWGEGIMTTFGYSEDKLDYDESWLDEFVHPDDKERVFKEIEDAIKNRLQNCQNEYRFRCADGIYKYVFDRGYILYDENKKPRRMIGAMTDLTEKKRLETELSEQQIKQQKLITETTIQVQEKEKNDLGRELHDNINQILATVKMYLGMAKANENVSVDLVGLSYEYVTQAMQEIRNLSHSLVAPSLGDIDLKDALQELVENANLFNNLQVELLFDEKYDKKGVDKNKELTFYRIVQEQMNNIIKYAGANKVVIDLKTVGDYLVLSVADDGVGFDVTQKTKGIGLKNISSRVEFYSGNINIISAPGQGCTLEVSIPC